jgi:hypothetical protein
LRTEIVDSDFHTELLQTVEHAILMRCDVGKHGFRHVEFQVHRGKPPFRQCLNDRIDEFISGSQLPDREIDRNDLWSDSSFPPGIQRELLTCVPSTTKVQG